MLLRLFNERAWPIREALDRERQDLTTKERFCSKDAKVRTSSVLASLVMVRAGVYEAVVLGVGYTYKCLAVDVLKKAKRSKSSSSSFCVPSYSSTATHILHPSLARTY